MSERQTRMGATYSKPFAIVDCTLMMQVGDVRPAYNMRDLSDRLSACSEGTLYHHFCETLLRPTFDDPDYGNDLAVWAKQGLGDKVLAERLSLIDPYELTSIEELRNRVQEIVEDRLAELSPWVPAARPAHEFHFLESTIVVFDTNNRIDHPSELSKEIRRMTDGSIFYHFLEGRFRPPLRVDDFTAWLLEYPGDWSSHISAIAEIDLHFQSLASMRGEIAAALANLE